MSADAKDPQPGAVTNEELIDNEPNQEDSPKMLLKPRQWLIDRSNGESKIGADTLGRPFCPMCWPPPCVKVCPDLLEQNPCCEGYGRIGVFPENHECSRIWLMRKSMVVHLCGLVLSILGCLAITRDPTLLEQFAYSSGVVTGTVAQHDLQQVEFHVGLTTIYVKDFYYGSRTYDLDDLCTGSNIGIPLTSLEDCQSCSDASGGLIAAVIMGVVTYIPTIAANVNRAYYNYDINCQKVLGSAVALFNMIMSLYTWKGYANSCVSSFFDGDVAIPVLVPKGNATGEISLSGPIFSQFDPTFFFGKSYDEIETMNFTVEDYFPNANATLLASTDTRLARLTFHWSPGLGLTLVVVATFLKLIDIINHFLIKTPSITRDAQEQLEYENNYGSGANKTEEDADLAGDEE